MNGADLKFVSRNGIGGAITINRYDCLFENVGHLHLTLTAGVPKRAKPRRLGADGASKREHRRRVSAGGLLPRLRRQRNR